MVVVASPNHPLVKHESTNILELMQEKWVLREVGSGTREAADAVFERHKTKPDIIMNYGSTQAIKEAVMSGLGISLLSKWAIQREIQNEDLSMIHVNDLPFKRKFSIITASSFQTKAQQVFIELLHNSKEITDINFNS